MANLSKVGFVVMWQDGATETLRAVMCSGEASALYFASTELASVWPRPFIFKAQEVKPCP